MEVQPDFRDLFALLNKHAVECLIVGDYALAFHGAPRYTGDIDILVKPDSVNYLAASCEASTLRVIKTKQASEHQTRSE